MIFNNSRILVVVLSFLSLVLLAVLAFGAYHIETKNRESNMLLAQAKQTIEERILSQSIRMTQNAAAKDLDNFEKITLSSDKTVSLIENIEAAGRNLGLETEIASVDKVEGKQASDPAMIRIIIKTEGSWNPTLSFLRAMESLPYRVLIDEYTITALVANTISDKRWKSQVTLALHIFD